MDAGIAGWSWRKSNFRAYLLREQVRNFYGTWHFANAALDDDFAGSSWFDRFVARALRKLYFWGGQQYSPLYVKAATWFVIVAGPTAALFQKSRIVAAILIMTQLAIIIAASV